jgi:hypothetical protein
MKLQEQIRKVLKEETKLPIRLLRRFEHLDDEIVFRIKRIYTPKDLCRFRSSEELLEVVSDSTIDAMYWTYFSDVDDNSKEWGIMYRTMIEYINDKYGEEIKKYYHINCGN